jgi:hypothetical protein
MPTFPPAPAPPPPAGRVGRVAARILTIVGVVLVVVSILANFVRREALDTERFRDTAGELIASDAVRDQIAVTLVEQLYANVDVSGSLEQRLPEDLKSLAGPIAGLSRELADRAALALLDRPRVQLLFVEAAALAQRELVRVLEGGSDALATEGGDVVLNLRPLVLRLGERISVVGDLDERLPETSGRIVILRADELETAQELTRLLKTVANWIWALALAAWAAAVWLARGRRRVELRAIVLGLVVVGVAVVTIRRLAGVYVVNRLVEAESVKEAADAAWGIITDLLADAGWTVFFVGLVALGGVWLCGPGRRATAWRRSLAPYLRRADIAYGTLAFVLLLLVLWAPTAQFRFFTNVVVICALALLGLEALRRQVVREFPDAEPVTEVWEALWSRFGRGAEPAPAAEGAASEQVAQLERLAALHASGALDDAEYAAAKSRLLG